MNLDEMDTDTPSYLRIQEDRSLRRAAFHAAKCLISGHGDIEFFRQALKDVCREAKRRMEETSHPGTRESFRDLCGFCLAMLGKGE